MPGDVTQTAVRLFIALLAGAVAVALVSRKVALPYSVGLVLVGLVLARLTSGLEVAVTPELVLGVLLPGLIFEAALRTGFEELRPSFIGVLLLAVPGVVIGAWIVALVLQAGIGMDFGPAFLVGAMVAATDPAAVIATFRRTHAPKRLATFVEGESVLNDGTGIVLFTIGLAAVSGGDSPAGGVVAFAVTVTASVAIGAGAGYVASRILATVDDHLVELTLSVVLAYGSYQLAEIVHASGIIATVLAGVTLGSYGRTHGLSPRALEAIDTVWEFIAFVLTALIFLLLGLAISLEAVSAAMVPIAWAVAAVLAARAIVVYVLLGGASRLAGRLERTLVPEGGAARPVPAAWLHVLFWAGLRGAVSVAMALSLPREIPDRDLLQGITFGVVLFTLVVQGSTADLLVRRVLTGRPAIPSPPAEQPPALG